MSSNFGIYGPAYELCVNEPLPGKEEYIHSEKYEVKAWDWDRPGNIKDVLARLNAIRRENPALQMTRNIRFCTVNNDKLLAFYKATGDFSNIIIVIVNLDPHHPQSGMVEIPLDLFGIPNERPYPVHDLLTNNKFTWQGEKNFVQLDPSKTGAHIIRVTRDLPREQGFDYFL
jgi:starch synthase (maltosyl-transferring)